MADEQQEMPSDVPPEFALAMRRQNRRERSLEKANARRRRMGKRLKPPPSFVFEGKQPETGGQGGDPFSNPPNIMSAEYPDVSQFVGKLREDAQGRAGDKAAGTGDMAGTLRSIQEQITKLDEKVTKIVEWTEESHQATFGE